MKSLDHIPVTKMERAGKLVQTGVKLGGNYMKYYGKKLVNPSTDRSQLDEDNARDVYDGLKSLKGSALKVAQMLSMEKNLLPRAYVERFSLAQFSVPPLSAPLVRKTFRTYFGAYPEELYDRFEPESVNAASIGQVHRASKDGKALAVKIQYPGVSESISSDLALVKPIAMRMFNLSGKDSDKYFREVEDKLLEETDYLLELEQSRSITNACSHLPGLRFPEYYPQWSSRRILTMDWMVGEHLGDFTKKSFPSETGDRLGQALWDFYMFQIHGLRKVHADPHPGNFLVGEDGSLIAIDFGCIKEIPESFYNPYFELAERENIENDAILTAKLQELEILTPSDSPEELTYFKALFREMLELFTSPFNEEEFDFSSTEFWGQIADLSQRYSQDTQIRKMNANRGSRHFLYINRTFFGLYNLLHDLKARVRVNNYQEYLD
ncbi:MULTISPECIES: ABC1 kinase family protein [unclassified Robiginitalea]|uniref:ABC1 kinase family protein n=1 Tax=Robiginitalea TaxID=252306 RepID=UPI0023491F64|nr:MULTISPECIES: AarF/ABC1/UbiB kinase family protein [unclassified Robiginitalea]MDC6354763.1 AarF/ABC1/UbiB kinase family protein [Robiginitalea sp. PM2]MDC6375029.1 AarF/ABC1/UbiB kinase family protein [Robiginitalea sp. SP8]